MHSNFIDSSVKRLTHAGCICNIHAFGARRTHMTDVQVAWINNNDRISPRKQIVPAYPPEALAQRLQDVVIVEFTVVEDGTVADTRIVRSVPPLDDAAIDAVQRWEFAPTR